ncbi:hypothetical protein [Streptomyces sp. NPDC059991]|uniref:hypothetical protein n=1 Tax=unclassified Streptomyces TaxID=2593676 RepID=UPI0036B2DAEA
MAGGDGERGGADDPVPDILQAWSGADPNGDGWEALVYTDAELHGPPDPLEVGPFQMFLTYSDLTHPSPTASTRLLLRARYTLTPPRPAPDLDQMKANARWWLNVQLDQQAACLLSLALGVRMRSGGRTRRFSPNADPAGVPELLPHRAPTLALFQPVHSAWPALAHAAVDIRDAETDLKLLPAMSAEDARVLLRAARHFATALWIADDDPEQAWLQLVTAAEVAATHYQREEQDAVDLFRRSAPGKVATALIEASTAPDLLAPIAGAFHSHLRATSRFQRFFADFAPPPPAPRPLTEAARLDWSTKALKNALGRVYELRSRLLHDGQPFPYTLLQPPERDQDIPAERPFRYRDGYGVGPIAWPLDELPMYLPTFAHIVHMSLLRWWRSLPPGPEQRAGSAAPGPELR